MEKIDFSVKKAEKSGKHHTILITDRLCDETVLRKIVNVFSIYRLLIFEKLRNPEMVYLVHWNYLKSVFIVFFSKYCDIRRFKFRNCQFSLT